MKKILLMGSEGAGKTSMHSVIFANYPAKDTHKIGYTIEKKEHKLRFMGNLTFNLWDCGGQDTFMDNYFMLQRQALFKNVEVVIYVFDIDETKQRNQKSMKYWKLAVQSVEEYNPNAVVFVLLHKIDRVPANQREQKLRVKKQVVLSGVTSDKVKVKQFFATSIWDQTLYQAWSQIIQMLIPNRSKICKILSEVCEASKCEEAALFERSTFLILGYYHKDSKKDIVKYQKIANIIKQFKLTCKQIYMILYKYASNIQDITVQTNSFCCLIREFTKDENILVVYRDREAKAIAKLNIGNMGKVFELEKRDFGHD